MVVTLTLPQAEAPIDVLFTLAFTWTIPRPAIGAEIAFMLQLEQLIYTM